MDSDESNQCSPATTADALAEKRRLEPENSPPTLEDCAEQANLNHTSVQERDSQSVIFGKKAIQFAIGAGASLKAAKAMLKHGDWLPWLMENVSTLSEETAQRYMRLEKASHVQDLSGCETLRQA